MLSPDQAPPFSVPQTEVIPTPANQTRFDEQGEKINSRNIYVITPEDYEELTRLSCEDADSLPDGAYLIDQTLRDRLAQAGIDYDNLSRAVVAGLHTEAAEPTTQAMARTGKTRSKHQVFFGSITLEGPAIDQSKYDGKILIAVKPHENNEDKKFKPYKEVGNAALMQKLEMPGVYKPVGIIKQGDTRFVMTEQRPGVRTFDDHNWMRNSAGHSPAGQERERIRERDVALVTKAFELLGMLHARGIFHGDAQEKNLGWANKLPHNKPFTVEEICDLYGIQMTIVDVENSAVFLRDDSGDFEPDYYSNLVQLATKDVRMFFGSIPKSVRFARPGFEGDKQVAQLTLEERNKLIEEYVLTTYVDKYFQSFADERSILLGHISEAKKQVVMDTLRTELIKALRPLYLEIPKPTKKEIWQAKHAQELSRAQ